MDPERDLRLLTRAKWVGVVLPIGLIWAFELVRYFVIDPSVPADSAHVFAALVMSGGAVLFALGIFAVLDRTQRRLVDTNRDLAATHAVAATLQGAHALLAETPISVQLPAQSQRPGVDATVVDVPLAGGVAPGGAMRLLFH